MVEDEKSGTLSRRTVLASATLLPVAAIKSAAQTVSPAAAPVFTAPQRQLLEAFVDRLIPKDETGPGAVECGAVGYFERQLTGYLAKEKAAVLDGLAAVDAAAREAHNAAFVDLTPEQKDAVLTGIQSAGGGFFNRIRRMTLEATFGDPYYGGNKGFAGWDLIRYPGPRLAVSPQEQKMAAIKPMRKSAWGGDYGR
jgi:gluconate 2-dehydrogenase gamma chain